MAESNTVWSHIGLLVIGLGSGYILKDWMVRGDKVEALQDVRTVEAEDVTKLIESNNRVVAVVQKADKDRSTFREIVNSSGSGCPIDSDTGGMLYELVQQTNGPKSRKGDKGGFEP